MVSKRADLGVEPVEGGGTSVGLFFRLPDHLAKLYPPLEEDGSPSHVTFLYVGEVTPDRESEFLNICRNVLRDMLYAPLRAHVGSLDYFEHPAKNRRVAFTPVRFSQYLGDIKEVLISDLQDAGFGIQDSYPVYRPHVTLAYLPGLDSTYTGTIPVGSWETSEVEVWGLPQKHVIKFQPQQRVNSPSGVRIAPNYDLLVERVARKFVAKRPIPIDKTQIKKLVNDILRQLPKEFRFRKDDWDERMYYMRGFNPNTWKYYPGVYVTTDVTGQKIQIPVIVGAARIDPGSKGYARAREYVAGGSVTAMYNSRKDYGSKLNLRVNFNFDKSFAEILANKDQVAKELYSVLIHEVTHVRDMMVYHGDLDRTNPEVYYNLPTEVRAFMQQIVDEVEEYSEQYAEEMEFFEVNESRIQAALDSSKTWDRIRRYLNDKSRRLILQAVYRKMKDLEPELKEKYEESFDDDWDDDDDWTPPSAFQDWEENLREEGLLA